MMKQIERTWLEKAQKSMKRRNRCTSKNDTSSSRCFEGTIFFNDKIINIFTRDTGRIFIFISTPSLYMHPRLRALTQLLYLFQRPWTCIICTYISSVAYIISFCLNPISWRKFAVRRSGNEPKSSTIIIYNIDRTDCNIVCSQVRSFFVSSTIHNNRTARR